MNAVERRERARAACCSSVPSVRKNAVDDGRRMVDGTSEDLMGTQGEHTRNIASSCKVAAGEEFYRSTMDNLANYG